jgi:hypothetical protein
MVRNCDWTDRTDMVPGPAAYVAITRRARVCHCIYVIQQQSVDKLSLFMLSAFPQSLEPTAVKLLIPSNQAEGRLQSLN